MEIIQSSVHHLVGKAGKHMESGKRCQSVRSTVITTAGGSGTLRVHHHALFLNCHCPSAAVRNLCLKALLGRQFHSVLFTLKVTNCAATASVQDPNVRKVDIFFLFRSESKEA